MKHAEARVLESARPRQELQAAGTRVGTPAPKDAATGAVPTPAESFRLGRLARR